MRCSRKSGKSNKKLGVFGMQKMTYGKRKEYITLFILSTFIFCFVTFHINDLSGIQHTNDESGYWTAAAYLLGYDWSELASYNLYYSYGYGIFLAILMKFFQEINLYQVAIVFNSIVLVFEFWIIVNILKKLFIKLEASVVYLISFVMIVYPYNIFYVHLTVCEVFLSFLCWLILAIYIRLLERDRIIDWIFFAGINALAYMVHQRSVGIILASIVMAILLAVTRKSKLKHIIICGVLLSLLFFVSERVKQEYVASFFQNASKLAANDYSGQVAKLDLFFSLEGIPYVLFGVIGKWFGICVSTCMLVSFGLVDVIKKCICGAVELVKHKRSNKDFYINCFLMLSFFAGFGINVIFMIYPEKYADYLIYTRYSEIVALPIVAIGLYRLYTEEITVKEISANCGVLIVLVGLVIFRINDTGCNQYVGQANVAIWDLYSEGMDTSTFLVKVTIRAIVVCLVLLLLSKIVKNKKIPFFILAIFWLYVGGRAYQKDNYSRSTNEIREIAEFVNTLEDNQSLYYYCGTDEVLLELFHVQLQEVQREIQILESENELEKLQDGSFVILKDVQEIRGIVEYIVVNKSRNYYLIEKM